MASSASDAIESGVSVSMCLSFFPYSALGIVNQGLSVLPNNHAAFRYSFLPHLFLPHPFYPPPMISGSLSATFLAFSSGFSCPLIPI